MKLKELEKKRGWESLGVHLLANMGERVQELLKDKDAVTVKTSDRYMRYVKGFPTKRDGYPTVIVYRRWRLMRHE